MRKEKQTKAAPVVLDSKAGPVTFRCWETGILRYAWRTDDGALSVHRNYNRTTYSAYYVGARIGGQFRSYRTAMRAAVKHMETAIQ